MRRIALTLLLILPIVHASIVVYTNGIQYSTTYEDGTGVDLRSVDAMIDTWRSWGYDVVKSDRIDPRADGLIVLGCTKLEQKDIDAIREYIQNGGRVVLDLHCKGPLDDIAFDYGFLRSGHNYVGVKAIDVDLPYARIRGYAIDTPFIRKGTPANNEYVALVYAGPTFQIAGERLFPLFTPKTARDVVAAMDDTGNVILTGCFICGNQYFIANVLDYLEDGKIDFPDVKISRRVYPEDKLAGKPVYDEVTITFPPEESTAMDAIVNYVYNEPGFCKLVPKTKVEEDIENGVRFIAEYAPTEKMRCMLGPVIAIITWKSPEGEKKREIVKYGEYIDVGLPATYVPESKLPWILGSMAIITVAAAIIYITTKKERDIKRMRKRLSEIEYSLKDLERKLMTRQISEDIYKELVKDLTAEAEAIKARLREYEKEKIKKELDRSKGASESK